MPSRVRIFWWLSVAIAAYWIVSAAWYLAFPSAHYLATLARLQPELRESVRRFDLQNTIFWTSFDSVVIVGLAWLAAFRRRNWARWAFVVVFLFRESIPFLLAAYYRRPELAHRDWTNPLGYVVPALSIAAIVFVFSERDWFRSPQDATSA